MLRNRQEASQTSTARESSSQGAVSRKGGVLSSNYDLLRIVRVLLEFALVTTLLLCVKVIDDRNTSIEELLTENLQLSKKAKDFELQIAAVEIEKQSVESSMQLSENARLSNVNQEKLEMTSRIKTLEDQAKQRNKAFERMQKYLSDTMQDACSLEYPTGPAHVAIETSEGDIEIEMAPCDVMPVVTMHFLRQVKDGLWDGMSFFRGESHVIQASDLRPDGSRPSRSNFIIKRSKSIPFQEYSEEFVHKKYTLGIAGRPGGPDFYVNMLDNVRIHGPGGQGHNYQGDPDSDSCFAKIVRGEEVAVRIQKQPFKREGGLHILVKPVEIISMKIIEAKDTLE